MDTEGDVTATPAIADGVVYFTTWAGEVFAVREDDGKPLWRKNLTQELHSQELSSSRSTPVVHKQYLFVGINGPALQLALDRGTGNLLWSTQLDPHPDAVISCSGTVFESAYYVGVSSDEEGNIDEPCCSFQGSMVSMDVKTGRILWQTKMVPDNGGRNGGYSGAAIWGSSPPVDAKRRHVYVATGNLYSVPADVEACQEAQNNKTTPDVPDPCIKPDDHSESILALDLDSGRIVWSNHLGGYDTWVLACDLPPPSGPDNCPKIAGPDSDFGEAPMMLTVPNKDAKSQWLDIVVAGQKSGFVWALERDHGKRVWDAVAGPGGTLGGASWGSATDGDRVYTSIINNEGLNFTLDPSSRVINAGGWVAMDASTGEILWSVATPNASYPLGPVTVANGVLLGTSLGVPNGAMHALDAKTGAILWSEEIHENASISGGVSVHSGCMFVPQGVSLITAISLPAKHGHAVDAFCVKV